MNTANTHATPAMTHTRLAAPAFRLPRHLQRTALCLAVMGALSGTLAGPARAAVTFNLQTLAPAGFGGTADAVGLSDLGQVVGSTYFAPGKVSATRWKQGLPTALPGLSGSTSTHAKQGNNAGVVVGGSEVNGLFHAVTWTAGNQISVLPEFGSDKASIASGINAAGIIVGTSESATRLHAVMWANGQVLDLGAHPTFAGTATRARAVNNGGQVLITGESSDYLWQNGSLTALKLPAGGIGHMTGNALNDQGWVTGFYVQPSTNSHAALWRNGTATDLGDLYGGAGNSYGIGLNNVGQVVGGSSSDQTYGSSGRAFIWANGQMVKLDEHLRVAGWTLNGATAINAHGQITAFGTLAGVSAHVLLTPTGSLAWAATAGGSFADAANWDSGMGFAPGELLDAQLVSAASQKVMGPSGYQDVKSLLIGGGSGTVTLALQGGAVLNAINGSQIASTGILTGDGTLRGGLGNAGTVRADNLSIDGAFQNTGLVTGNGRIAVGLLNNLSGGRIQGAAGAKLQIVGNIANTAGANIELVGGAAGQARLEVAGTLDNQRGASLRLREASLQTGQLNNGGQIAISFGTSDVFGKVNNTATGTVIASGAANVTFWDNVTNQGEFRASAGARMVYFGLVNGAGSFTTNGGGSHRFEGGYAPGNSPAVVTLGDVEFASELTMELAGTTPGNGGAHHDKIIFTGSVLFGAGTTLNVVTLDGFTPLSGQHFDLFDFSAAPLGQFASIALPQLAQGLNWDVSQLYTQGEISISGAPMPVPEPASGAILLAGLTVLGWRLRRRQA